MASMRKTIPRPGFERSLRPGKRLCLMSKRPIEVPPRAPRRWEFWSGSRRHLVEEKRGTAPWDRFACRVVPPEVAKTSRFAPRAKLALVSLVEAPAFRDPRYCGRCFAQYVADDEERREKVVRRPTPPPELKIQILWQEGDS